MRARCRRRACACASASRFQRRRCSHGLAATGATWSTRSAWPSRTCCPRHSAVRIRMRRTSHRRAARSLEQGMKDLIDSIRAEYQRYKALGEGALQQVRDDELSAQGPAGSNSLAVICWHLSGNLRSRFTDFLTTDGEKPWRNREEEFDDRVVTRETFLGTWGEGGAGLFRAIEPLTDAQLSATITIRQQPMKVYEALLRSL